MKHIRNLAIIMLIACMLGDCIGINPGEGYAFAEESKTATEVVTETEPATEHEEVSLADMEEETVSEMGEISQEEEMVETAESVEERELQVESETGAADVTSDESGTESEESSSETESKEPVMIKAPTMKSAKSVSYNSVKVSWAKADYADKYNLYARVAGEKQWQLVASTKKQTYTVKDLECGVTYEWTCGGVNTKTDEYQDSKYGTNIVSAKPRPATTVVRLKSSDASSATISWEPVEGATSYKILYRKNDAWKKKTVVGSNVHEYTWSDLKDGTIQKVTVRPYHGDVSGYYNTSGIQIARKAPKVQMYSVCVTSGGKGSLKWNRVPEVNGYFIYRKDNKNDTWKKVGTVKDTKLTWSETGLSKDLKYTYLVKGYRVLNEKKVKGLGGNSMSPTLTFSKEYVRNVTKTYLGTSGAGRKMYKFTIGSGSKHLNIISEIHGYEDNWKKDSVVLIQTAEETIKDLAKRTSLLKDNGFQVNVIPMANPDGYYDGYTCNGPGRCTTYRYNASGKLVKGGLDLNRCFPVGFSANYNARNYTGPKALMAKEAKILKSFVDDNKGGSGNYFVDVQGWYNQIITNYSGSGLLYKAFKTHISSLRPNSFGGGYGYIAAYARSLGYQAATVEFPDVHSSKVFYNNNYDGKFINAVRYIIQNG